MSAQLDEFRAARDAATARLLGTDRVDGTVETKQPAPAAAGPAGNAIPVRLEADAGTELRVRVYPDDVHIDTHEPGLTEDEERGGSISGSRSAMRAPGGDQPSESSGRGSSSSIGFGAPRAAWIARRAESSGGQSPSRRRDEAWTRAAHTQVLPDRWVAIGYREDNRVVTVWGKPIPDTLATGPSPQSTNVIEDNGLPPVDEGMRWMIDFDAAEAVGMALRIPLTDEQARCGFERVVVVGIKASLDGSASAARLARLFDAHHYTDGLAFVEQNVPTNNTAEAVVRLQLERPRCGGHFRDRAGGLARSAWFRW